MRRLAACVLLLLAASVVAASSAHAHAIVENTEPGIDAVVEVSPANVVIHFNEPIEAAFGAIRVYDTTGVRVDTNDVDYVEGDSAAVEVGLAPNLADGTYTVTWRVISADSHVITEAFVFHVGAPGSKPQGIADEVLSGQAGNSRALGILFGFVRAVGFASMLLLIGAFCFLSYVWHVADVTRPPERFYPRWMKLATVGWAGTLIATLIALPLQAAQAGGVGVAQGFAPSALADVITTRFGRVMFVRAVVLIVAAAVWTSMRDRMAKKDGGFELFALCASVALLVCTALAGHAGSTPPVAVNVPVDVLHLLAVSAWVGGLAVLVAVAFPAFRGADTTDLGRVVSRYSDVAVVAVAVVVITGTWQSFVEVKALSAFDTTYGQTLLAKIALFLPLVGLGAINNRWAKPRIEKASDDGEHGRGLALLRRLVAVEVAIALVVVGITSFLVNLPPARVAAGVDGPFITDVAFGDNELNVLVDPNKVGENEVHLTVSSPQGAAVDLKEMRVLFTMPAESIGPTEEAGTKLATGHFVVQGHQLSVPGRWTLEVIGRLNRFDEARVRVPVTVNG